MTKFLLVVATALFLVSNAVAMAPKGLTMPVVTRNDIQLTVARYAYVYDVNEDLMNRIIHCESTHNINAVNISSKEESYGLVQINIRANTDVSKEEALDYDFAIRYLAKNLSEGRGRKWSCFKLSTL